MSDKPIPLYDVKTIEGLIAGSAVGKTELKIRKVLKRAAGTNNYGEWSFQRAFGLDDTGELSIVFKNVKDCSELEGKKIRVVTGMHEKKPVGIVVIEDQDKEGKPRVGIQITGGAKISVLKEDGEGQPEQQPEPQGYKPEGWDPEEDQVEPLPAQQPAQQPEPKQQPAQQQPNRDDKVIAAKKRIMKSANLMAECQAAARIVVGDTMENATPEMIKDIGTALYIQATRDGLIDNMPCSPIARKS